jgi:hypothetical protein
MVVGSVTLHWIPVGAGGHVVRHTSRWWELVCARRAGRTPRRLFHAALTMEAPATTYAVEMGPAWGEGARGPGVVATGPVGMRALGALRAFRYEVRCTPAGRIPDLDRAESSVVVGCGHEVVDRLLVALRRVPTPTWGRDELGCGDMWNSNSLIAWALLEARVDLADVRPPRGGRAPGWDAGLVRAAHTAG